MVLSQELMLPYAKKGGEAGFSEIIDPGLKSGKYILACKHKELLDF